MSTDAEWLESALAEVEAMLEMNDREMALRIQAAVRSWVDATLFVDDAVYRERFERRLGDAIFASHPDAWCDGTITALDVARTLHTCTRASRLHETRLATVTLHEAHVPS